MRTTLLVMTMLLQGCTALMLGGAGMDGGTARSAAAAGQDADITAAVQRRLSEDAELSRYRISVTTWRRRVTLAGEVASAAARNSAERRAAGVSGVTGVSNGIRVTDNAGTP